MLEADTHSYFTDSTLANPSVRDDIPLLVRLELLNSMYPGISTLTLGFVDASVCSRGYESEDRVLVADSRTFHVTFRSVEAHWVL